MRRRWSVCSRLQMRRRCVPASRRRGARNPTDGPTWYLATRFAGGFVARIEVVVCVCFPVGQKSAFRWFLNRNAVDQLGILRIIATQKYRGQHPDGCPSTSGRRLSRPDCDQLHALLPFRSLAGDRLPREKKMSLHQKAEFPMTRVNVLMRRIWGLKTDGKGIASRDK